MSSLFNHLTAHLSGLFPGENVHRVFWKDRKRGHPHVAKLKRAQDAAPRCRARNNKAGRCGHAAQRGSSYCWHHNNPTHYANRIKENGKQCTALCVATGERCKNRAAKGFEVCWNHGAKAILTWRAIQAVGDNPVAATRRKAKQATHRARAAEYRSGKRVAAQESWAHFLKRQQRDERIERRYGSIYDEFSEQRSPAARPLKPLSPA